MLNLCNFGLMMLQQPAAARAISSAAAGSPHLDPLPSAGQCRGPRRRRCSRPAVVRSAHN